MALMLLTVAIFFNYVISFQLGLAVPLFCRPAERRPTKHQEEPSVGEVFFFLERGGVWNGDVTSGVCQRQSCFHRLKNANKDLLQDFTESDLSHLRLLW